MITKININIFFTFLSSAFSFESGTGNSSSFSYVDVYNNGDYRCSQGSLQNQVFLLRELETGITENTTGELNGLQIKGPFTLCDSYLETSVSYQSCQSQLQLLSHRVNSS